MAITLVASSNNSAQGNNVSTLTCAFGAAVSVGDLEVAHIGWGDAGSYTEISANHPHTADGVMTRATGNACVAGNSLTECIYYIEATSAATHTVGVDWGANQPYIDIRVQAFTGFTGTPTFDESAGASGSSATASTGASGTTDVDAELVVVGGMTEASYWTDLSVNSVACTGRWRTFPNYDAWGYKVQTAAATQTGTSTTDIANWAITLATFKDVVGGGATASVSETLNFAEALD